MSDSELIDELYDILSDAENGTEAEMREAIADALSVLSGELDDDEDEDDEDDEELEEEEEEEEKEVEA